MKRSSIMILALIAFSASLTRAQNPPAPEASKFDEFTAGIGSPEFRHGNWDQQQQEVKTHLALYAKELRRVGARPYAITYGPRVVPWETYGRSIAESRGAALWQLTPLADWREINFVNGGFREIATTELWIVPPGAQPPCPTPTVKSEDVVYCPYVRIAGVPYVPHAETTISFKAHVELNRDKAKPVFSWEVSQGEILSGQGTDSISVKVPPGSGGEVVARVRLEGFSLECPAGSTAAVGRTAFGLRHYLFDEFGNINCEDELARLDGLAMTLQSDPSLQVHIMIYGGRFGARNEALARAARMKGYLTATRGMEADRILMVDGGYRDTLSGEWWLSARGTEAPTARPTVDKRFVKLRGTSHIVYSSCSYG